MLEELIRQWHDRNVTDDVEAMSFQLVERAAELPGVVLKEGPDWTNVTVRGKGFAWVDYARDQAMIKVHAEERDALLATSPTVYQVGWTTSSTSWVRVRLDQADPEEVFELLEEAWRMTATKRAVTAHDEARRQPRRDPPADGRDTQ